MTTYASTDFKTKKAFKDAVKSGSKVTLFSVTLGFSPTVADGVHYVSGPQYPAPHSWYATVTVKDGFVTAVK